VAYPDENCPEFSLESVSRALSEGWDPNTAWSEDELVFRPPGWGCVDVPTPQPWSHFNTAIHRAMEEYKFDVAECLLKHGADINQLNASGRTVLHEAIEGDRSTSDYGQPEAIAWVIEHGADLDKKSEARTVTVAKQTVEEKSYAYHQPGGLSPLRMAVEAGQPATVQMLTRAGANVNLPFDEAGAWRPLYIAFILRQLEIVEALEHAGASFWARNECNKFPATSAVGEETETLQRERARDLLTFYQSGPYLGLPKSGCDDVFHLVLETDDFKRAWQQRNTVERPSRYQDCIETFFRVLSSMAEVRNPVAMPDFYCALCRSLFAKFSSLASDGTHGPFQHSSSLRELEEAAASNSCPFCNLLLDSIDANLENKNYVSRKAGRIELNECPVEISLYKLYHLLGWFDGLSVACGRRESILKIRLLEGMLGTLTSHFAFTSYFSIMLIMRFGREPIV